MPNRKPFLAALLLCVLAVAGCAHQPAGPAVAFGSTQTFAIGESLRYDDGLILRLEKIEDSRCKQGMICVWAGELAPMLELRGGFIGDTPVMLRLGTGRSPQKQQGRYHLVLRQVTPTATTLVVTRQ